MMALWQRPLDIYSFLGTQESSPVFEPQTVSWHLSLGLDLRWEGVVREGRRRTWIAHCDLSPQYLLYSADLSLHENLLDSSSLLGQGQESDFGIRGPDLSGPAQPEHSRLSDVLWPDVQHFSSLPAPLPQG